MTPPPPEACLYPYWAEMPTWMIEAGVESSVRLITHLYGTGRDVSEDELMNLQNSRRELAWRVAHGEQLGCYLDRHTNESGREWLSDARRVVNRCTSRTSG